MWRPAREGVSREGLEPVLFGVVGIIFGREETRNVSRETEDAYRGSTLGSVGKFCVASNCVRVYMRMYVRTRACVRVSRSGYVVCRRGRQSVNRAVSQSASQSAGQVEVGR